MPTPNGCDYAILSHFCKPDPLDFHLYNYIWICVNLFYWDNAMDRLDFFAEMLDADLDSWFSADIACCDNCHDDFTRSWPQVYLNFMDFQTSAISLDDFYAGTRRLSELFSKDDFSNMITTFSCPRCDSPFTKNTNIWPYCFPFNVPDGFEDNITEIAEIADKTPFLVLSHPFAKEISSEIKKVGLTTKTSIIEYQLFRGRLLMDVSTPFPSEFYPPSKSYTAEGRYNHAGKPVLYLATDKLTCFNELGKPAEDLFIASVKILQPLKVLDLFILDNDITSEILSALITSSLLSSPSKEEGWDRPGYVFSRFVADCALSVGFDAIVYPSTKASSGKNIVVFNDGFDWDKLIMIDEISKYKPS